MRELRRGAVERPEGPVAHAHNENLVLRIEDYHLHHYPDDRYSCHCEDVEEAQKLGIA